MGYKELDVDKMKSLYEFGGLFAYKVVYYDPLTLKVEEAMHTFNETKANEKLLSLNAGGYACSIKQECINFDGAFASQSCESSANEQSTASSQLVPEIIREDIDAAYFAKIQEADIAAAMAQQPAASSQPAVAGDSSELFGAIRRAVEESSPRWGDAHDNPNLHKLTVREREWIAGRVLSAVAGYLSAPAGGGVAMPYPDRYVDSLEYSGSIGEHKVRLLYYTADQLRTYGDDWELRDPHGNGSAFRKDEVPPIVSDLLEALTASGAADANDGCGACGDGCKGRPCRVEMDSPPAEQAKLDAHSRLVAYGRELIESDARGVAADWRREYAELMARKPDGVELPDTAQAKGEAVAWYAEKTGRSSWSGKVETRIGVSKEYPQAAADEGFVVRPLVFGDSAASDHAQHAPTGAQVVTDEAVERLARYMAREESLKCKTFDEAIYHQSKWQRIVPEARAMLTATLSPAGEQAHG